MFNINFNQPTPVAYVSLVDAVSAPVIVVVDVTSLKALDVAANDLFSSYSLVKGYFFVTIEDFDKIGFHLVKIGFEGDLTVVFCTGSETGEIVHYAASSTLADTVDPYERVVINELPAVEIKAGQTIGLQSGTKVGVSSIDSLPDVGIKAGQSVGVNSLPSVQLAENQKVGLAAGTKIGVSSIDSLPAVDIKEGQSVGISTLPAVQLAAGQKVGLDANTKVAVSQIDQLPSVQLKENQSVNIGNSPAVAIAPGQEIGLSEGSKVAIDGEISAAIAADQAIGVYPVRRN